MNYLDSLALTTPAGLAFKASNGRWLPAAHLILLADRLVALARGDIDRLMVFMPPRHGKSELCSKYFPAWYLGTFPERRVILSSYEANFAAGWGRKARDILKEHGGMFGVEVSEDSQAAAAWNLQGRQGGMDTAGVGGPITGKGADLFVIDDPLKNAEEAQSETIRNKQWDWWQSTARTRLHPGGKVLMMMTRWHEDDLAGKLLADADTGADQWEVLCLPAVAEQSDRLGREPGEALWPSRYSTSDLSKTKRASGPYWWSAMYQQRPAPEEGGIFGRETFRCWSTTGQGNMVTLDTIEGPRDISLDACTKFATIDPAVSTRETADYFVMSTWAISDYGDLLLLDCLRDRIAGPDQPDRIRSEYEKWRHHQIGVERMGYQLSLLQELVKQGLPVMPLDPDKDKVARASLAAARYKSGKIFHPKQAAWLHDFEEELLAFPNGAHDDQVDTVAYAARIASQVRPQARKQRDRGHTTTAGLGAAAR